MLFAEVLPQSCVVKSFERLVALLKPKIIQYIYSAVTLYLYFTVFPLYGSITIGFATVIIIIVMLGTIVIRYVL